MEMTLSFWQQRSYNSSYHHSISAMCKSICVTVYLYLYYRISISLLPYPYISATVSLHPCYLIFTSRLPYTSIPVTVSLFRVGESDSLAEFLEVHKITPCTVSPEWRTVELSPCGMALYSICCELIVSKFSAAEMVDAMVEILYSQ